FNCNIGRRKCADRLWIASIATLAREHGRNAVLPEALNRSQDAQLVVDDDVVFGRKATLDVIESLFLVNIDQYTAIDRVGQAPLFNFVWLKDDVPIGQDNGRAETS